MGYFKNKEQVAFLLKTYLNLRKIFISVSALHWQHSLCDPKNYTGMFSVVCPKQNVFY